MIGVAEISGELLVKSFFKCDACGKVEPGSPQRILVRAASAKNLIEELKLSSLPSHDPCHMPIGWCSHIDGGKIIFKCPACKEKR